MEAEQNKQDVTQEAKQTAAPPEATAPKNEAPPLNTGQAESSDPEVINKAPQVQEQVQVTPVKPVANTSQQPATRRATVPQTEFPDFINNAIQACQAEHEEAFQPSLVDDLQKFWQRFTSA